MVELDILDTQFESCEITHDEMPKISSWQPSSSRQLAAHTTFRVGGQLNNLVVANTDNEIIDAANNAGERLLVISGGSNMLAADHDLDLDGLQIASKGINYDESACGGAYVRVKAGELWDEFVALAIKKEWIGIEALSGIPGLVGAAPIQNIGAYGQEAASTIVRVLTWDRQTKSRKTFVASQCQFGYRNSIFKKTQAGSPTGRYVILEVHFQFLLGTRSTPVAYQQLANSLGVEIGERANTNDVRQAVLELRRSKGMVLDPNDHDSWSAGSFFTNPVLSPQQAAQLPAEAPRFKQADGNIKTSAAWLIEHAGFTKGWPAQANASLSTKHVLALTNRGRANAAQIWQLARVIRDGVEAKYQIQLVPEPVLIGIQNELGFASE